jgi:hypothetical protein
MYADLRMPDEKLRTPRKDFVTNASGTPPHLVTFLIKVLGSAKADHDKSLYL